MELGVQIGDGERKKRRKRRKRRKKKTEEEEEGAGHLRGKEDEGSGDGR
jgi:hypothetical protein